MASWTGNQVCLVMVGSEPPQFPFTASRLRAPLDHDFPCPNKPCSDLKDGIDSSAFRVLLLRRLWLPLPPSSRSCRCGRLLDVLGHVRVARRLRVRFGRPTIGGCRGRCREGMAPHTPSEEEKTVLHCDWPVVGKNVPTLSYQVNMEELGWSFWIAK